jgi:hypothetical protein
MTVLTARCRSSRSTIGKLGLVLLLASIGTMTVGPAFAQGYYQGRHDHHRGWRHGYDRRDWRGAPEYEPYQEVYAPPPVYYPPQPSPGVNLFFPIRIR